MRMPEVTRFSTSDRAGMMSSPDSLSRGLTMR